MKMKVYREWLCDENNNIVKKPLSFWFEFFGVTAPDANIKWFWTDKRSKRIDIEKNGGDGLLHDEYDQYKDKLFFCGNADLDNHKLREVVA